MIEQDYILRLMREFFEALELLLRSKKSVEIKIEKLQQLYEQYVGPADFYHAAPMEEVMASFERFKPEERLYKMEMLAELYFVDADWHTGPARDELMQRALNMFRFVDRHGKTYSMDRLQKISQLEKQLANGKP